MIEKKDIDNLLAVATTLLLDDSFASEVVILCDLILKSDHCNIKAGELKLKALTKLEKVNEEVSK